MSPGDNPLAFTCEGPDALRSRAEVTAITCGPPVRGCNARQDIDWTRLRREYEPPRTITAIDGCQNTWTVSVRPEANAAGLEMELSVEQIDSETAAYEAASAVTLESFDLGLTPASPPANQAASYAYDATPVAAGCSPDVTQSLTPSSDVVKLGNASVCYQAISQRQDNGGWSVKGRSFPQPLDLTPYTAIGFWLHGDEGYEDRNTKQIQNPMSQ